eukprot:TRINITY_DN2883_c0_g2_i1.p1 TRINITY_DN2883_c0_g2~~TRINITY_DN2883_c0_g2_i1.p1  ORF type:complete len:1025 (+),score=211.42 TRINITY_DN2883_c0_g2_i1:142-3216(+)
MQRYPSKQGGGYASQAFNAGDLQIGRLIGRGGFGQVYEGLLNGTRVAVKRLPVPAGEEHGRDGSQNGSAKGFGNGNGNGNGNSNGNSSGNGGGNANSVEPDWLREVRVMEYVRHPNIIFYYGVRPLEDNVDLIMEYADGGSLRALLQRRGTGLEVHDVVSLGQQIAAGLAYLYSMNPPIAHRDVKSDNVLLVHRVAKLTDFGLSKWRPNDPAYGPEGSGNPAPMASAQSAIGGTIHFMAPECFGDLNDETVQPRHHGLKSDVYSYALVLWELLTARIPFEGIPNVHIIQRVLSSSRPAIPVGTDPAIRDIITSAWAQRHEERPDFYAIIRYLQQISVDPDAPSALDSNGRFNSGANLQVGDQASPQSPRSPQDQGAPNAQQNQQPIDPLVALLTQGDIPAHIVSFFRDHRIQIDEFLTMSEADMKKDIPNLQGFALKRLLRVQSQQKRALGLAEDNPADDGRFVSNGPQDGEGRHGGSNIGAPQQFGTPGNQMFDVNIIAQNQGVTPPQSPRPNSNQDGGFQQQFQQQFQPAPNRQISQGNQAAQDMARGMEEYAQGNYALALNLMEQAGLQGHVGAKGFIEDKKKNHEELLKFATSYLVMDDYDKSYEYFQLALKLSPNLPYALVGTIVCVQQKPSFAGTSQPRVLDQSLAYQVRKSTEKLFEISLSLAGRFYKQAKSNNPSLVTVIDAIQGGLHFYRHNINDAITHLETSAAMNNNFARCRMGDIMLEGLNGPKDPKRAVEFYQPAAEEGNAYAEYRMGHCNYFGLGMPINYEDAFRWYQRSGEKGEALGLHGFGYCYIKGRGVSSYPGKAFSLFLRSAELGYGDSQMKVAECYYRGLGVAQDYKEALRWFQRIVDSSLTRRAYWRIGEFYEKGLGTDKNLDEAFTNYLKSADLGDGQAQFKVAKCYFDGDMVKADKVNGMKYLEMSVQKENPDALCMMGCMLLQGNGVPKNKQKAFELHLKAAQKYHGHAQLMTGDAFLKGIGTRKDYVQAAEWYTKASKNGETAAADRLHRMKSSDCLVC